MKKSLLLMLLLFFQPGSAGDREEWVMYFKIAGGWGTKVELWLNSENESVVGTGAYFENIPCSQSFSPEQFDVVDETVQRLIVLNPKASASDEGSKCFDELRVQIQVSLQPQDSDPDEFWQPVLAERFSFDRSCSSSDIHVIWRELATKVDAIGEEILGKCNNSPFGKDSNEL
jgi:hypothetical protein